MSDGLVKILDGNTFVVSDRRGDIEASPDGSDRPVLVRHPLSLAVGADDRRAALNPLSVDDLHYFEARFFLVPGTGTVYVDAKLSVIRRRAVGDGFREQLTIFNHDHEPVDVTVRIEAASDFADLFEVKDALEKKGELHDPDRGRHAGALLPARDVRARDGDLREPLPRRSTRRGLTFAVQLEPHGAWTTEIDVSARLLPARAENEPPTLAHTGRRESMDATSTLGGATRPASSATGSRSRRPTGAASSISPRCASRRRSCPARACRPPACRGSWRCSAGTASSRACRRCRSRRSSRRRRCACWRCGRARASTTSATRTPAGSCTRCATGR